MKGKSLKRALKTSDAYRVGTDLPKITSKTELITPERAYEMLLKNEDNRPINWRKVEEFAGTMRQGDWKLHGQGIVVDINGNLLTGQKRLWAVIYAGVNVYMTVSYGNPPEVARLLDRGVAQSATDLASRGTGRKHRPMESSIARAVLALEGNLRPSKDRLANKIENNAKTASVAISATTGTRKTRPILMILGAICHEVKSEAEIRRLCRDVDELSDKLEITLLPQSVKQCWGRGAAFSLAMGHAQIIVKESRKR